MEMTMKQARKMYRQDDVAGQFPPISFRAWVRSQSNVTAASPKLQEIIRQGRS